jgi:hypothetical protein
MNETTTPAIELPADFAAGEHTEPATKEAIDAAGHQGDFAAGERTHAETPAEDPEAALHGDFAAGDRSELPTPAEEIPGTFADTAK